MAKAPTSKAKKVTVKKPRAAAKPKAQKKVAQPSLDGGDYVVTLDVNEKIYDADGKTAVEALQNLAVQFPDFFVIKTRAVLSLTVGARKSSQIMFGLQVRRLLKSFTVREIWGKRLEATLK